MGKSIVMNDLSVNFYIRTYRRGLFVLLLLELIIFVQIVIIYFAQTTKPSRDFYSTNGITPPTKLKSMLTPNYSSEAMLAPDPENIKPDNKTIPD